MLFDCDSVAFQWLRGGGVGHTHNFNCKIREDAYLKSEATCQAAKQYYYSCECGAKSEEKSFTFGTTISHDYSVEEIADEYLKSPANCIEPAVYYKSCSHCGEKSTGFARFTYGEPTGVHEFTKEVAKDEYLITEARDKYAIFLFVKNVERILHNAM